MPTPVPNDVTHPQNKVTTGQIAAASLWSVFFLAMIILAMTDTGLGGWIEVAAHY
jgi:hypothetical protein